MSFIRYLKMLKYRFAILYINKKTGHCVWQCPVFVEIWYVWLNYPKMAQYTLIAFNRSPESTHPNQNTWIVTFRVTSYWGIKRRIVVKPVSFGLEYPANEIEAGMQSHLGITYKHPEDILKSRAIN